MDFIIVFKLKLLFFGYILENVDNHVYHMKYDQGYKISD